MQTLPMETQNCANVTWQENANANIANGKPTPIYSCCLGWHSRSLNLDAVWQMSLPYNWSTNQQQKYEIAFKQTLAHI